MAEVACARSRAGPCNVGGHRLPTCTRPGTHWGQRYRNPRIYEGRWPFSTSCIDSQTPNVVCRRCSGKSPAVMLRCRWPRSPSRETSSPTFAAGRGTVATARCIGSIRRSIVMRSLQLTGEVCPNERKFVMFWLWTGRRAGPTPIDTAQSRSRLRNVRKGKMAPYEAATNGRLAGSRKKCK